MPTSGLNRNTHSGRQIWGGAAGQKQQNSVFFKVTLTHKADKTASAELWDAC